MRTLRHLPLCLLVLSFLYACTTPRRYIESSRYDDAIALALRRLSGKKNKKTETVKDLERAFAKAQERDLKAAQHLAATGRPENWRRINQLHRQIAFRQGLIAPLLPLVSKNGYRARFEFVDIARMESESRERAAEYLYNRAQALLERGRNGDRKAARAAYEDLCEIENQYYRDYRDKDALLQEALHCGTVHIGLEVINQSNKILPARFSDRLLSFEASAINPKWNRFYLRPPADLSLNYRVVFTIDLVNITPERVLERQYTEEKTVEDGWEYILDERGNVKKDSLGNDMKRSRWVKVCADVVEVQQSKAAQLAGVLSIYDERGCCLLSRPLSADVFFENSFLTYQGDRRALSAETLYRLGQTPMPFPSDADMLLRAAERLTPLVRNELYSNSHFR